jgi:hypothetical protein
VTLDGSPVEGASVTFVSESGTETYSGGTDSKGEFSLFGTDQKSGVKPGTYKVVVTKTTQKGEAMAPASPGEAGGAQQKEMMNAGKDPKSPPKTKTGPGGMPMMPVGPGAAGKPSGVKTELPVIYASAETTPLKVTIPSDSKSISIELKSK